MCKGLIRPTAGAVLVCNCKGGEKVIDDSEICVRTCMPASDGRREHMVVCVLVLVHACVRMLV